VFSFLLTAQLLTLAALVRCHRLREGRRRSCISILLFTTTLGEAAIAVYPDSYSDSCNVLHFMQFKPARGFTRHTAKPKLSSRFTYAGIMQRLRTIPI
jgi:hypothetical protein